MSYPNFYASDCVVAMEERRNNPDDDDDDDTTASRFVTRLLRFLLKGCQAKDKIVRYRVVQCISEMIAHLGELECVH